MSRFIQKSYVEHLNTIKKILRYITGIKDLIVKFIKLHSFSLSSFSYSNYEGDKDDKKSTFSYDFNIRSGSITWCSNKEPIVTLSIIEEKYRSMTIAS